MAGYADIRVRLDHQWPVFCEVADAYVKILEIRIPVEGVDVFDVRSWRIQRQRVVLAATVIALLDVRDSGADCNAVCQVILNVEIQGLRIDGSNRADGDTVPESVDANHLKVDRHVTVTRA